MNGPIDMDTLQCKCLQSNSRNVDNATPLTELCSYDECVEHTKLQWVDGQRAFDSMEILDRKVDDRGAVAYHEFNILCSEKIWVTDRDSSLTLCLNPCHVQQSEIPVSVRHHHDILLHPKWTDFNSQAFDSTVWEYTKIIRTLFDYTDIELLERYVTMSNTLVGEFDRSTITEEQIQSNKAEAQALHEKLQSEKVNIEDYLFENYIKHGSQTEPISWEQFWALQVIYAPNQKNRKPNRFIHDLTKEKLDAYIHPHYLTRLYSDYVELALNPDLLCAKPTSADSILFGKKKEKVHLLLHSEGIVFDNEKGWQQANIPCLHPPMSVGLSGLSIKIDCVDIFLEGKTRIPYHIKSTRPWDHIGPRGSNVFAWADMWFEMIEAQIVEGTSDSFEYTSREVKLGTGRVHFNNDEIYGTIWLHHYQNSGDPYGDIKGTFVLDGEVQPFDKLLFQSSMESQGGQMRMERIGDAMILRWWVPANRP